MSTQMSIGVDRGGIGAFILTMRPVFGAGEADITIEGTIIITKNITIIDPKWFRKPLKISKLDHMLQDSTFNV